MCCSVRGKEACLNFQSRTRPKKGYSWINRSQNYDRKRHFCSLVADAPIRWRPLPAQPPKQRLFLYMSEEVRAFEEARNVRRLGLLDSFGLKRESVYKLMCCYLSLRSRVRVCFTVRVRGCAFFVLFFSCLFLYICILLRVHKRNEHMSPLFYSLHKATVETRYEKKKTRKKNQQNT